MAGSLQFSGIVKELADQAYIGTAPTFQLALGFTIGVATLWIIPIPSETVGWRRSFAVLTPGPIVGALAMLRLRSLAEAAEIAGSCLPCPTPHDSESASCKVSYCASGVKPGWHPVQWSNRGAIS